MAHAHRVRRRVLGHQCRSNHHQPVGDQLGQLNGVYRRHLNLHGLLGLLAFLLLLVILPELSLLVGNNGTPTMARGGSERESQTRWKGHDRLDHLVDDLLRQTQVVDEDRRASNDEKRLGRGSSSKNQRLLVQAGDPRLAVRHRMRGSRPSRGRRRSRGTVAGPRVAVAARRRRAPSRATPRVVIRSHCHEKGD